MDVWQQLVSTALVGTSRQPFVPPAGSPLDGLALPTDDPEGSLLTAAAVLGQQRLAGKQATPYTTPLPTPDPPDPRPMCSAAAAQRLELLLSQHSSRQIAEEWLQAANHGGLRVPPVFIPNLIEAGLRAASIQPLLLPVLGERAAWVAKFDPEWHYATAAALSRADDLWQTGTNRVRELLLELLRQSEPERARELLASTWQTEPASQRERYLHRMATGLGQHDEPFLEAALDDRSRPVRAAAAALLVRLPESRLVQRMRERLIPLLAFKRGMLGSASLRVAMPTDCDKAMQRDGITPNPPAEEFTYDNAPLPPLGDAAWWLQQIVSAVPPAFWGEQTGLEPAPLLKLLANHKGDTGKALLRGVQQATINTGDLTWAHALLDYAYEHWQVLGVLSPAEREQRILSRRQSNDTFTSDAYHLLPLHAPPWSEAFSRSVLHSLRVHANTASRDTVRIGETISTDSVRQALWFWINPVIADEIEIGWNTDTQQWKQYWQFTIEPMLTYVNLRHQMYKELAQ